MHTQGRQLWIFGMILSSLAYLFFIGTFVLIGIISLIEGETPSSDEILELLPMLGMLGISFVGFIFTWKKNQFIRIKIGALVMILTAIGQGLFIPITRGWNTYIAGLMYSIPFLLPAILFLIYAISFQNKEISNVEITA